MPKNTKTSTLPAPAVSANQPHSFAGPGRQVIFPPKGTGLQKKHNSLWASVDGPTKAVPASVRAAKAKPVSVPRPLRRGSIQVLSSPPRNSGTSLSPKIVPLDLKPTLFKNKRELDILLVEKLEYAKGKILIARAKCIMAFWVIKCNYPQVHEEKKKVATGLLAEAHKITEDIHYQLFKAVEYYPGFSGLTANGRSVSPGLYTPEDVNTKLGHIRVDYTSMLKLFGSRSTDVNKATDIIKRARGLTAAISSVTAMTQSSVM